MLEKYKEFRPNLFPVGVVLFLGGVISLEMIVFLLGLLLMWQGS